ncbi:hypothetical protein [Pseudomonas extremaustralis]|uniref:hypothetical protein n=1 Tax=Pseudomonas extremaustralis TaxID=359110 RepID=UPI001CC23C0F|nr:hypothetical protein [Pseudomonas extremaustralis]
MQKKQYRLGTTNALNTPTQGRAGGGNDGGPGVEKRLSSLEKGLAEMKEKLFTVSNRADSMEKHFATKADLATTELNLIKWYVATAFAMTGLACAITFGLTRLLAT